MSKEIDIIGEVADRVMRPTVSNCRPSATTEFAHPADVLGSETLTQAEKRTLLESWASDVRAIVNQPALRKLDNRAVVRLDDILNALSRLNGPEPAAGVSQPMTIFRSPFERRRRRAARTWLIGAIRRGRSDGDDDPPPCPAAAARPVRRCFNPDESVRRRTTHERSRLESEVASLIA